MLATCFFVIKLYNIIKKENVFGQRTDFAKVLKGNIDFQFVIVNKTYGTLTQLMAAVISMLK